MANARLQVLGIGLFSGPWVTMLRIKILCVCPQRVRSSSPVQTSNSLMPLLIPNQNDCYIYYFFFSLK